VLLDNYVFFILKIIGEYFIIYLVFIIKEKFNLSMNVRYNEKISIYDELIVIGIDYKVDYKVDLISRIWPILSLFIENIVL